MDIGHKICHIYYKNADIESIFLQKDSLHCSYKCAKFSSTCKIIFIFSCILSSDLWDNFLWMTLYHIVTIRNGIMPSYSKNQIQIFPAPLPPSRLPPLDAPPFPPHLPFPWSLSSFKHFPLPPFFSFSLPLEPLLYQLLPPLSSSFFSSGLQILFYCLRAQIVRPSRAYKQLKKISFIIMQ